MPKVDIEAATVCPSLCTNQLGDLKVLVESKSALNMQKEGLDDQPGLVLPCPSFASYSCSDQVADTAVKVSGKFDNLTTLENKSDDHAEDDDFTFDISKWGQKFFFGPVFPVFNRDLLLEQFESSQRDLEAMEEKSKSTATGTDSPARMKLSDLFEQVDGRSFVKPTSTSSKTTKRSSSAYDWKLRDVARQTNSEGATMSSSRSSTKKPQRRSWVDRCIGQLVLCFSSS